ncbi:electron transport complex subunit RsxG [Aestuariibacter halophilus]|uniref:Ion-translocating oxidoreductase complex subunit G n=1 Tax=Fluctibacter halophilus TaxID=226011 RepID=A0ABS8G893_9ALTE|nr:electron transport complex subunit RsxG [Aestuariibacter halophilus]MCC2616792.1 electron transport complex subunit RsxG [Aestuariibacter halophilus]
MLKSIARHGGLLALFALVTTGLISATYWGTADTIATQQNNKLVASLNAVLPASLHDNDVQHDCVIVSDAALLGSDNNQRVFRARLNGNPSAVAIETIAPDGYSGNIALLVGVTGNGEVTGVRVQDHKETPGLGDKIDLRISDWILDFTGMQLTDDNQDSWAVRKDGGQFDQFTGATITPRAVVGATKRAVQYYQQHAERLFRMDNQCAEQATTPSETQESAQ